MRRADAFRQCRGEGVMPRNKHLIVHVNNAQHAFIARMAASLGKTRTKLLMELITLGIDARRKTDFAFAAAYASAIEARRAETGTGSVHESASLKGDAKTPAQGPTP
jgi:hypothetical protein